ncbi:MAG: AMP-binding protein [Gammaproteobacteria bacterium]
MTQANDSYALQQAAILNPDGYTSLVDAFDHIVAAHPERTAYTCLGQDLTYSQIEQMSGKLASFLQHKLGLAPGSRIAIQLPNLGQYPVAAWGAFRAGLVLVNTNPMYTPTELIHQFNDSGAQALIVLSDLLPVIEKVLPETGVKHVIATHATDMLDAQPVSSSAIGSLSSWADVMNYVNDAPVKRPAGSMEDTAVLQYTGGTTGVSKGAELSHRNLYCAIRLGRKSFAPLEAVRRGPELTIAPMPLYHVYGFVLNIISVFITGGQSVLIPNPRDVDSMLATMKQHPFTGFAGVNTLFSAMLQHPEFDNVDWSHLDLTVAGGAAMAVELAERWHARTGQPVYEGYGLSETCATGSVNRADSNIIGSVGLPNAHTLIRMVDEDGNEVAKGEEGELCMKGPHVMMGYWNRPDATAEVFDEDGWFKTGDVAIELPGGQIKIVDRIKDMILVSGFNVYPNEIEDAVYRFEGVIECAAVGVKHEATGEAVKLFVVCTNSEACADDIITHCREHLTGYKVPKMIEFRDELPKSNVGKILRRMLRD